VSWNGALALTVTSDEARQHDDIAMPDEYAETAERHEKALRTRQVILGNEIPSGGTAVSGHLVCC